MQHVATINDHICRNTINARTLAVLQTFTLVQDLHDKQSGNKQYCGQLVSVCLVCFLWSILCV